MNNRLINWVIFLYFPAPIWSSIISEGYFFIFNKNMNEFIELFFNWYSISAMLACWILAVAHALSVGKSFAFSLMLFFFSYPASLLYFFSITRSR